MVDKQRRGRTHLPALRVWQPILVALVSAIGGVAAGYFANSQQQKPEEAAQHWLIIKGVSGVNNASVRLVVRVNSVPFAYPVFASMAEIEPAMPEMRIPLPCGSNEYIIAFEGTLEAPRLWSGELRSREAVRFKKGHLPDTLQQYELLLTTTGSSPRYVDFDARPRVLYSFQ